MAGPRKKTTAGKKKIEAYDHKGKKRANNPPVGLVTPETDPDRGEKRIYDYDPHLDPQLVWAGKAERTSFEIPRVSLHVRFSSSASKRKPWAGEPSPFRFLTASKIVLGSMRSRNYLIRLAGGETLVLEVKGQDSQENQTKREFLGEWVRAVSQHGGFGQWSWDVSRHPADLPDILQHHNQRNE